MNNTFTRFGIDNVQLSDISASAIEDKMRELAGGARAHIWLSSEKPSKRLLAAGRYMREKTEEYWVEFWDEPSSHVHVDTPLTWDQVIALFTEGVNDPQEILSRYPHTRQKHSMFGLDPLTTLWPPIIIVVVSALAIFVPSVGKVLAIVLALFLTLFQVLRPKREEARTSRAKTRRLRLGLVRYMLHLALWSLAAALAFFGASMSFPAVPGAVWKVVSGIIFCFGLMFGGTYVFQLLQWPKFMVPVSIYPQSSHPDSKRRSKLGMMLGLVSTLAFAACVAIWIVVPAFSG